MAICRGIHNFQSHPNMILLQYCWWRSPYNIPTRLSFLWLVLWRFPEIGVPLFIIHFTIGYVPLNHPAIGIPPFMEIPWYKVVPPSYKWVIIPLTSSDISPTNHSEIGLICTNLANYGAPPCRRFPKDLGALWTSHGLCWDESMNKPGAMKPGNGKSPVCRWPISSCKGKIL